LWGCRSTNQLCMRVWTIYLQCRRRWRPLLRNVNLLLDHKRTHNMKGLIRSHVHFHKCRTQIAALYTVSSLHHVRFFPHTPYALNSPASISTRLQFVPSCALYQPPPYGTPSPFHMTLQATSNPTICSDHPVFLQDLTRNNLSFVQECGTGNATISITGPNIYYY